MRIRILSDLHLEFSDWMPPVCEADVVVLAGDVGVGVRGIRWARRCFGAVPLVYVPGNHEFYGGVIQDVRAELRATARREGVHLLDRRSILIGGTRFLGATLWTDFALYGSSPSRLAEAMADAEDGMNDFHVIGCREAGRLRPERTREIHLRQLKWLRTMLTKPFEGSTVVVTHHLPHRRSVHAKYEGSRLNPCFASDLSHLVRPPVALWIHGHTHVTCDYVVNGTRVVCNPRGYLPFEPNPDFDPSLTVDVGV